MATRLFSVTRDRDGRPWCAEPPQAGRRSAAGSVPSRVLMVRIRGLRTAASRAASPSTSRAAAFVDGQAGRRGLSSH
jgi:hypothetical protein